MPPVLLHAFRSTDSSLAAHGELFASGPSFFYTLAVGLLIGVCASTRSAAGKHCLTWMGLALCLELSQYPSLAKPLSSLLSDISPGWVWHVIGPYWARGVFDPLDLLATLIGGCIALILSGHLYYEHTDSTFC